MLELASAPDVDAARGADKAVVVTAAEAFPVVDVELEAEVHADATNATAVPITTRVRLAVREVRRIWGDYLFTQRPQPDGILFGIAPTHGSQTLPEIH